MCSFRDCSQSWSFRYTVPLWASATIHLWVSLTKFIVAENSTKHNCFIMQNLVYFKQHSSRAWVKSTRFYLWPVSQTHFNAISDINLLHYTSGSFTLVAVWQIHNNWPLRGSHFWSFWLLASLHSYSHNFIFCCWPYCMTSCFFFWFAGCYFLFIQFQTPHRL